MDYINLPATEQYQPHLKMDLEYRHEDHVQSINEPRLSGADFEAKSKDAPPRANQWDDFATQLGQNAPTSRGQLGAPLEGNMESSATRTTNAFGRRVLDQPTHMDAFGVGNVAPNAAQGIRYIGCADHFNGRN